MSDRDPSRLVESAEATLSHADLQEKRERVRRTTLAILANNPLAKLTVRHMQGELELAGLTSTTDEAAAAMELLAGLGLASAQHYWLGATLYYKITAEGTLAHERDGL